MKKASNEWPQFLLLKTKKRRAHETQGRRKEIIKIKAEINKIETRQTTEMMSETTNWGFFL